MHCSECKDFILVLNSKKKFENQIDKQRCFGCGILISNAFDYYHCENCEKYFLCFECRYCKEGHCMQKVVYLDKLGYSENVFGCDICGEESPSNDDGIWHCQSCNYDICPKCLP